MAKEMFVGADLVSARVQRAGTRPAPTFGESMDVDAAANVGADLVSARQGPSPGLPLHTKCRVFLFSPHPEGDQDDFLIRADKNPNTKGAELLGFKTDDDALFSFLKDCEADKIEGAVIFGQDLLSLAESRLAEPALKHLAWTVFIGSNQNLTSESATHVLASAAYAEKNGTFTNFEGRVQKFTKAFEPLGESRPEADILQALAFRLGRVSI